MWDLRIQNIAGIRSGDATVHPGLNVVQASNFMGKSSFISAIQTAMGTSGIDGEAHPLTEGEDEGSIELETPDSQYEVTLDRTRDGVVRHGETYLEDETDRTCARLFAFLGEDNPVRARVRNGDNLTELLQAPLDIEDIDAQIQRLRDERGSVEDRLEAATRAADNLSDVRETIAQLENELEELQARRAAIDERAETERADAASLSDELAQRRSDLTTASQAVSRLERQIERKQSKLEAKRSELDEIDVPEDVEFATNIADRQDRIDELSLRIDLLEGVHRANQRVLEEGEVDLVASVERNLTGDELDCWVCGETTTETDIQQRLSALEATIADVREKKSQQEAEIEEQKQKRQRIENRRQQKQAVEAAIGDLTAEIDELEGDLQRATQRVEQFQDEITDLEAQVEQAEAELNEELTDIKAEIRTIEQELEDRRSQLAKLTQKSQKADELRSEREQLTEEIAALRTRKKEKQWEIKDQFDTAMNEAIEQFAPGFDGARLDVKTTADGDVETFELIVAREGRETEIGTLSEGERELVGIVVAVAGYRTFDVAERVPVMLLDGISQLSADNLWRLVDFLDGASEMLVTTAYPEAGECSGSTIYPTDWETISDGERSTV